MNQLLLTLGALTLGGSAAVVLLALAGRSTRRRYAAKWRCWAWLVLCLRLAVPLPLPHLAQDQAPIQVEVPNPPAALPPAVPTPGDISNPAAVPPDISQPAPGGPNESSGSAPPAPPAGPASPEETAPLRPTLPLALLGTWLLVAAVILLWSGWSHLRFLSYLRRWSSPVTDGEAIRAFNQLGDRLGLSKRPRLLVCQGLKVPMLAGMFRPAILLPPEALSSQELGFSLLHELTHYRRRDIWLKTLAIWVSALHWFNPFLWYMVRLVERDTELACDEDALRTLPPEACAAYGQTILSAVARLQSRND